MTVRALPQSHRLRRTPKRFWAVLKWVVNVARTRKQMAQLDDHILRDIGLTRDEAEAEAARPVWDVPPHWKC